MMMDQPTASTSLRLDGDCSLDFARNGAAGSPAIITKERTALILLENVSSDTNVWGIGGAGVGARQRRQTLSRGIDVRPDLGDAIRFTAARRRGR